MQEPAGPQVLIVDDDVSMQRMLRSRLEREGYHVVTASDGDEGLSLIRKHVFNLVITDMRMPKVKGDELARSITQFNPDIPVIVMTAYGEVNEAVRVMQDGVSYYMTKPFDVEELVQRVRKAVERHRTALEVNQVRSKIMSRSSSTASPEPARSWWRGPSITQESAPTGRSWSRTAARFPRT